MEMSPLVALQYRVADGENPKMENELIAALESCPDSKPLSADAVVDPDFPRRKLRRFYEVLCQFPSTPGKKDLVNCGHSSSFQQIST